MGRAHVGSSAAPFAGREAAAPEIAGDLSVVDGVLRADVLVEELKRNWERLADTRAQLQAVMKAVTDQRNRMALLRREVRPAMGSLSESVAPAVRDRPAGRSQPAPVPFRSSRITAPDPVDAARQQLHEAYAANRDAATRDELMRSYDGFARSLALGFRHRDSLDDLVQVARIGLLHAIDRFDPSLGRPFPLFARITITGELKRHLRDKTWAMRVPRSLQEDYLAVMRAVDDLTAESAEESPPMEKVAAHCGMSLERVVEAMELRFSRRALSLDMPARAGSEDLPIDLGQEDVGFSQLENHHLLAHLLGRLPERDRRIVELRFVKEMTQAQIADEIGVSQMCVSRVLTRTLGRLRIWARTELA
jgi:RNA polymerase sigma-B factor